MNMHEHSDNNQGMEWEKGCLCECVRKKEMEKVLVEESVFVRLQIEEHGWCFQTEWQKVSEEVMQAKERENESKQSGCEIVLQEIKPVGVCTSVRLHNKGVTELIWVAWSLRVCLRGYWQKWPEHSVCSLTV